MISPQASLAAPREMPGSTPRVTLTPDGLIVEWKAPQPNIIVGPDGFTQVDVPGFELLDLPGVPRLPYSSALVALPPDSNPLLEIVTTTDAVQILQAPLSLGNQPEGFELDSSGQVVGGAHTVSNQDAGKQFQVVALEPLGLLRGIQLARLVFYPVIPDGDSLQVTTSLKVRLDFGTQLQLGSPLETKSDPMLDLVRSAVINPEQMQNTTLDQSQSANTTETLLQLAGDSPVAVEISTRGITDIPYAQLAAAGIISSPISISNLGLTRGSSNIAYDVVGDVDGLFDPGEKIRFFADPRFSRWTNTDTYLLHLDGPGGLQMGSRDATPSGSTAIPWAEVVFEDNEIYTPTCYCAPIPAGRDGDRWVGYKLQRPGAPTIDIPFALPGFDRSREAFIKLWLIGFTDVSANPDHKLNVAIRVNGTTLDLGSIEFNGKTSHEANLTIDANSLPEGNYQLSLTIPDNTPGVPADGIWLDAFSIRYALGSTSNAGQAVAFNAAQTNSTFPITLSSSVGLQAYDISNPNQPVFLTGIETSGNQITVGNDSQEHDYWVTTSSGIQSPDNLRSMVDLSAGPGFEGADYVIISPEEFIPFLNPLVALHEANGLQVVVEDVQAIYDNYGGGRPLPSAIQDYLADAYFNWNQTPKYVLLVGDGTHDPKQYRETSTPTFIPPYLEDVDPWAGETAADNRYVTVDGSDTLPDMLIGRLPANSTAELETIVSKIVQYAAVTSPTPWKHQAVFVADNNDPLSGDFPSLSDILINKFPTHPFAAQRLYYNPAQATPEQFREMVNQVWDDGNGLIMFTGHASIHQWAHEILFHWEDVAGLNNGQKLPVVLEMTCFTGSYQIPDLPTLDESLLRQPGGGAIAVWGSTGLGIATGHHWLAEGFMNTIYQDGTSEIGSAVLAGKLNLASVGTNPDLLDTFTLLGDPATKLERTYAINLPITTK